MPLTQNASPQSFDVSSNNAAGASRALAASHPFAEDPAVYRSIPLLESKRTLGGDVVGIRADGGMCVRDVLRHRASSRPSGMHAELYLRPAAITAAHIFRFLDLLHSSDDALHFATAAAAVGAAKEDALALRVGGARPRSTVVLDARSGALVVSSSAEESEQRAALAYARRGASFRSSSSTASRNSREFQVQVQGRGAAWAVAKSGGGDGGGDSGGDGPGVRLRLQNDHRRYSDRCWRSPRWLCIVAWMCAFNCAAHPCRRGCGCGKRASS